MNKKEDALEIITVGYDEWEVHEHEFGGYEYIHYPFSIAADLAERIIIRYNEKKGMYDFIAEEYAELYGSGGWSRWIDYTGELKSICLEDAMKRIGK